MPDLRRQLDILSPDDMRGQEITVIGAGGIGSPTVLTLAKMGFPKITVYDYDLVEAQNLASQIYRIQDIGLPKVLALQDLVFDFSGTKITPVQTEFGPSQRSRGIVVSAVHTLEGRKEIWKAIKYNIQVPIYIDARMGAELLKVYTVNPADRNSISWYESKLFSKKRVFRAPCTEKAICYTTMLAAGLIANQVKKYVKGEDIQQEIVFDIKNLLFMLQ